MKRLRGSSLFLRLFFTHLGVAAVALGLLGAAFFALVDKERTDQRKQDVAYQLQIVTQMESLIGSQNPLGSQSYLVRTGVGRVVFMSPSTLNRFRTRQELPKILLVGEVVRRTLNERATITPVPVSEVPDVVVKEVSLALRALSDRQISHLTSLGHTETVCPKETRGTGVHCAVVTPLEVQPPVGMVMVSLMAPGLLDRINDLAWKWFGRVAAALAVICALAAWHLAGVMTSPLREMGRVAERVAAGDLSLRVPGSPPGEMGRVVVLFNQALDQLAAVHTVQVEAEQRRRDLVASISHEFRAPLASLRGYLELLQDGVIPREEQAKYVSVMLTDTFRMNRLLEDLLEYSRILAHQVTLQPMPTCPVDACHRVAEQLAWQAGANGVELVVDVPEAAPLVMADPDRLDQVLVNLLENALRYAGRGGWVRLSLSPAGGSLRFAVHDSGPGIPLEEQSRVWERFYKVEKARTPGHAGSGLGLAIVRQLVEAMGGQVGLQSQAGRGSTFWFSLPVITEPAQR